MKNMQDVEGTNKNETAKETLSGWGKALHLLIWLIVTVLAAVLVVKFVAFRTNISGPSMSPTLQDGDCVITERGSYAFGDPERYDVVVITDSEDSHTHYVKRIYGLPGEFIQITDNVIYINGEPIEDEYFTGESFDGGLATSGISLGEGEYFVMGDNRNNSSDSRNSHIGIVKEEQIEGKVFFRVLPLKNLGFIH